MSGVYKPQLIARLSENILSESHGPQVVHIRPQRRSDLLQRGKMLGVRAATYSAQLLFFSIIHSAHFCRPNESFLNR
jgi:hypothetical protein